MENMQKKVGRKPKMVKKNSWLCLRLDEAEQIKLQGMMEEFGQNSKSNFVRNCLFNRKIRVVKMDPSLHKSIEIMAKILSQYRTVCVNYDLTVRRVNTCFGERKAAQLMKGLEGYTIELVKLGERLKETKKIMEKYHEIATSE